MKKVIRKMGLKPRRSTTAFYSILEYTKEVLVSNKNNESQVSVQNLPNRPTKESDDQQQFLIDSKLNFSVDQSAVELNPVSIEKIAIAPSFSQEINQNYLNSHQIEEKAIQPDALQQLNQKNVADFKLSELNSDFINSSTNAIDLTDSQPIKRECKLILLPIRNS